MSRYIQKAEREAVDNSSAFRCAWCGNYLTERHHIKEYSIGGSNRAGNLILLCPNCHTDAHTGGISYDELRERRKRLSGYIDRSSGCLSVSGTPPLRIGGTDVAGVERIVANGDRDYLLAERHRGHLVISLELYNREGFLICWMRRNRWWVENGSIFDFRFSKRAFSVRATSEQTAVKVRTAKKRVVITGRMYVGGAHFEFDSESFRVERQGGGGATIRVGRITGTKESVVFQFGAPSRASSTIFAL